MKKFLSFLLSLSTILATNSSLIKAEESFVNMNDGASQFFGSSPVEYHSYSTYRVTIPMSINEGDSPSYIYVSMNNIEEGKVIKVYVTNTDTDGCITVVGSSGNEEKLKVRYRGGTRDVPIGGLIATFDNDEYTGNDACESVNVMSMDILKAGIYTGTLDFMVECVDK